MSFVVLATSLLLLFSPALRVHAVAETDAQSLEDQARYNYHIGQYYFRQGRFNDAERYFQLSRDFIEQRSAIVKQEGVHTTPVSVTEVAGGVGLEYTVGIGDVLYITVWQNDDLNQEAIVRPDGRLSFPLVGDLLAAGLTIPAIDELLTERLKEFLRYPEVSISIRKLGGSKVIILGQVKRPGVYAVSGSKTILEAIALAGGLTNDAVAKSVVLIRGGLQNPKAQRINLRKAMLGDLSKNLSLQSEDIIFVPKAFVSNLSYFLNQIIDPISRGAFAADVIRFW